MGRDKKLPGGGAGGWDAQVHELRQLFAQGKHTRLEARARQMVSRSPEFALGWKILSIAQLLQGRDALEAARRSVELLPDDAEAHNNLAKALQDAGRFEESRQACLQALRVEPGFAFAYNNLGIALDQLGVFDEAQAAYERALEHSPSLADAALNLGHLLSRRGHAGPAMEAYRRAADADPASTRASRALARMLMELGRPDEAIAV